jgi:hypothetical protein
MDFAKFAKINATIQLFPPKTTTILKIMTATRRTTMTFEFRLVGTYLNHPQYKVFRIGEHHSLGFVSVTPRPNSAYYFFANSSAILSQVDMEEIADFIKKENYRNDSERSSRAMIELETLPPTGRFHGNR